MHIYTCSRTHTRKRTYVLALTHMHTHIQTYASRHTYALHHPKKATPVRGSLELEVWLWLAVQWASVCLDWSRNAQVSRWRKTGVFLPPQVGESSRLPFCLSLSITAIMSQPDDPAPGCQDRAFHNRAPRRKKNGQNQKKNETQDICHT